MSFDLFGRNPPNCKNRSKVYNAVLKSFLSGTYYTNGGISPCVEMTSLSRDDVLCGVMTFLALRRGT